MINNDYHYEYLLKFLQKNVWKTSHSEIKSLFRTQISNTASENCCNDIYCNSFLLKNDMIAVSTASVIMWKSIAASREEVTLWKLIEWCWNWADELIKSNEQFV